nr:B3 domain-containing protein Os03g0212300-like [Lolium perenne]
MAGRGRGRGRGRGPGCGRAACSLSPATRSSSSSDLLQEEEQVLFEFVIVLKGDPLDIQRPLYKFADFIADNKPAALHLREAVWDCCWWPVDALFDGHGKMYLHTGWERFARYHDLEAGCVLTFSYLGDADMSVKVFEEMCCRWHYHDDTDEEDD